MCYSFFMKNTRGKPAKAATLYQRFNNPKYLLAALAAVVLVGGSFSIASGLVSLNANALYANVLSAITGRPMLILSRDISSPTGAIRMGTQSQLAIYDVRATNVTHWATVNSVPLRVALSQSYKSPMSLSSISMQYTYCIPVGQTYGYGFRSNGCASMTLMPSYVSMNGNTYYATFSMGIPVYPQQTTGTLAISATPAYAYTAQATNTQSGNGSLEVTVSGINASGDQCSWTYGFIPQIQNYGYGYTGCVSSPAISNVISASGNWLTVVRAYGYGYNALQGAVTVQQQPTAAAVSSSTAANGAVQSTAQSGSNAQIIAQLRSLIAMLLQEITALSQTKSSAVR